MFVDVSLFLRNYNRRTKEHTRKKTTNSAHLKLQTAASTHSEHCYRLHLGYVPLVVNFILHAICYLLVYSRLFSTFYNVDGPLLVIWILCMQCVRWNRVTIAIIVIVYGKTHEIMGEFSVSFFYFLSLWYPFTLSFLLLVQKLPPAYRIVRCYFSIVLKSGIPFVSVFHSLFMDECFFSFNDLSIANEGVERRGNFYEHCHPFSVLLPYRWSGIL